MSAQLYRENCQAALNDVSANNAQDDSGRQATTKNLVRKGFRDITVVQMHNMYGQEDEVKLTSEYAPPQKKESVKERGKFDKYAVLVRRIVERLPDRDILVRTELCIQSHTLCEVLRDVIPYTFDSIDIKSTPIVLPAPFLELFFKRKEIEAYIGDLTNAEELRAEVKLVHNYMQRDKLTIGNLDEYAGLIEQGKISFGSMWTLFPPNELLVRNDGSMVECWICRDVAKHATIPMCWLISGVRLDYDGHDIGLAKTTYPISFAGRVNGTMDIAQLPLIPVKYFEGWAETRAELVKRGEAFRELMGADLDGHAYRRYEGPLWDECELNDPPVSKINQRVVIDFKTYLKKEPQRAVTIEREAKARRSGRRTMGGTGGSPGSSSSSSSSDISSDSDTDDSDPGLDIASDIRSISGEGQDTDAFSRLLFAVSERYGISNGMDDLLLLSPARVPGYCLMTKEWGWMLIDKLKRIEASHAAFDSLQIDHSTKRLVKSLVLGHQNGGAEDFDDVIDGKGRGLVILLNGQPGIGKTLTAESISELTGTPLYNLSGGELSVTVSKVENKLQDVFSLAKRWGAIVLLDEADVVMSKRTSQELERNAIVAVWLRMLEYFEGILFLTSNRRDQFDEAFQSRIHLTINLPELGSQQRAEIWKVLVQKNKHVLQASAWKPEMFVVLGDLRVNGRVIKNLLRTAVYHARSCGEPLALHHISEVIKVELSEEGNILDVTQRLAAMLANEPGSVIED